MLAPRILKPLNGYATGHLRLTDCLWIWSCAETLPSATIGLSSPPLTCTGGTGLVAGLAGGPLPLLVAKVTSCSAASLASVTLETGGRDGRGICGPSDMADNELSNICGPMFRSSAFDTPPTHTHAYTHTHVRMHFHVCTRSQTLSYLTTTAGGKNTDSKLHSASS